MKRYSWYIFFMLITLGIQVGIFYLLTLYFTNLRFFDLMFIVGLSYVIVAFILFSRGDLLTRKTQNDIMRSWVGAKQNFKEERERYSIQINPVVVSSCLFFISSIVLSLLYW